jgi:hypothetical protein
MPHIAWAKAAGFAPAPEPCRRDAGPPQDDLVMGPHTYDDHSSPVAVGGITRVFPDEEVRAVLSPRYPR